MATSSCVKCSGTRFELKELNVSGSKFRLMAVQCASCGGVVGVQEAYNAGGLLLDQNKALKKMAAAQGVSVTLET